MIRDTRIADYINMIKNAEIRSFTSIMCENAPEYFWTLSASTSGRFHGNGSLVDHVVSCCQIMTKFVFEQMGNMWNDDDRDVALSAMITHDLYRCGYEGRESRYESGELMTSPHHPEAAGEKILETINSMNPQNKHNMFRIFDAVVHHLGRWGVEPEFLMRLNYSNVCVQVHNVDAHNAWNRQITNRNRQAS